MSKNLSKDKVLKLLIDIVVNPQLYRFVINMPGRFAAAEFLYENYYYELPERITDKIEAVLLASGKYKKIDNDNHANK